MKTNTSLFRSLAAAVVLAFGTATHTSFAQTTSTTTPVGFVTIAIAGGGTPSAPVYTFTSLGLVNPIAFQSTTTSAVGNTTIGDTAATWADNAYNSTTAGAPPTHFVEILSGSAAGSMYDIVTTDGTGKSLTVSPTLAAGVTAGVSYAIRPHWTLATVFGATNQNGLASGSATSADQVQLYRNQAYSIYYYQTIGIGGQGWRLQGAPTVDASNTVIYPDEGIIIGRQQSASVNLVMNGAVKTGQTSIPVTSGYSLLGNVYAAGMTLGSSNLYTGDANTGLAPGSATDADQILFWNGTSGYKIYYYQTVGIGGQGWRLQGAPTVDAAATPIPVGAALFIKRSGAAFNWVAPQTPASFN